MPERAHHYLGNLVDTPDSTELTHRITHARQQGDCLDVYLSLEDNRKGRIHAQATSGESVGIIKDRDHHLREGDIFQTESSRLVQIHLEDQTVLVIQVDPAVHAPALALIHLGHTLGNHHYPIAMQPDRMYVQIEENADVIEATIRNHNIPGLSLSYERRAAAQAIAFEFHGHGHHPHPSSDRGHETEPSHSHSSDRVHSHSLHS